jgi:hypothetical protein
MAKANKNRSYHRAADKPAALTPVEYSGHQAAFDHFNAALFDGKVPECFFTYMRKARSTGYFSPDRFSGRTADLKRHELALNPDAFIGRTDEQICQTLVHEMCHGWQKECGSPPARNYHNQEWSEKMKSIGLMPSSTGMVGGKETGAHMSDYIIPGGAFSQAYAKLAKTGWKLNLQSAPLRAPKGTPNSKTKFTCASCGQNAWDKPDLDINCRPCGIRMRAAVAKTELPAVSVRLHRTNQRRRLMSRRRPDASPGARRAARTSRKLCPLRQFNRRTKTTELGRPKGIEEQKEGWLTTYLTPPSPDGATEGKRR